MDIPDEDIDAFVRRIKRAWSGPAYRRLQDELRGHPDHGARLLARLTKHRSHEVRAWAANVARKGLGRDAIPLLMEMAQDRRLASRDEAMQQLEAIDLELLRPFVPEMRRIFRRSSQLYSPGGAAMWRLAKLQDHGSAPVFRAFAGKKDATWYDHRMPMVLADYLDDPTSVVRRIGGHDHDWMFWVATAAGQLDVPGAEDALRAGARDLPDKPCRDICEECLRSLLRDRELPQPTWDFET